MAEERKRARDRLTYLSSMNKTEGSLAPKPPGYEQAVEKNKQLLDEQLESTAKESQRIQKENAVHVGKYSEETYASIHNALLEGIRQARDCENEDSRRVVIEYLEHQVTLADSFISKYSKSLDGTPLASKTIFRAKEALSNLKSSNPVRVKIPKQEYERISTRVGNAMLDTTTVIESVEEYDKIVNEMGSALNEAEQFVAKYGEVIKKMPLATVTIPTGKDALRMLREREGDFRRENKEEEAVMESTAREERQTLETSGEEEKGTSEKITPFPGKEAVEEELDNVAKAVKRYCRENQQGVSIEKAMLKVVKESDVVGDWDDVSANLDERCLEAIEMINNQRARKERLKQEREKLENSERDAILKKLEELDDPVSAFTNKIVRTLDLHCVFWEDVMLRVTPDCYDRNIFKSDAIWLCYCARVWDNNDLNFDPWLIKIIASIQSAWKSPRVKKTIEMLEKEAATYGYSPAQIKQGTETPDLQGSDPYEYKYFQSAVRAANNWDLNQEPMSLSNMISSDFINDICNKLEDRVDEQAISRVEATRAMTEAVHDHKQKNPTWADQHKAMSAVLKVANAPSVLSHNAKQAKKQLYLESTGLSEEEYDAKEKERKDRKEEKRAQRQQMQAERERQAATYGGTQRGGMSYYGDTYGRGNVYGNRRSRGTMGSTQRSQRVLTQLCVAAASIIIGLVLFIAMDNVVKRTLIIMGLVLANAGGICLSTPMMKKTQAVLIIGVGVLLILLPAFLM